MVITITAPGAGATIDKDEITVRGTIDSLFPEFMIQVNGITAEINGANFVAAGVPLTVGTNEIIATATDIHGNTKETSITISTNQAIRSKVTLDASPENGVAPLEVNFSIEYSYPDIPARIITAAIDWEGDGVDDYTPTSVDVTHTYAEEGIYYPMLTLTDEQSNVYVAQTAINVYPMPDLVQIWNDMKAKLMEGDIEGALEYFTEFSKDKYRQSFLRFEEDLPSLVSQMGPITLVYMDDRMAEFTIEREEIINGTHYTITYFIYFDKDQYGVWRIRDF